METSSSHELIHEFEDMYLKWALQYCPDVAALSIQLKKTNPEAYIEMIEQWVLDIEHAFLYGTIRTKT